MLQDTREGHAAVGFVARRPEFGTQIHIWFMFSVGINPPMFKWNEFCKKLLD